MASSRIRAIAAPIIVDEVIHALWDGFPRRAELHDGRVITGPVWELYRSIGTASLRVRMSDESGRVHHFNTMNCRSLGAP